MANPSLRKALAEKRFILAPGVFDMISAKVADGMGFDCIYGTGFGAVASALGVADAGIATYADMVARMGTMARGCKTPLVADADTGYGGLLNVRHTTLGYEAAGMTGIQLEDQEMPKKCGHTPGRRVIPAEEMVLKIKVAAEARRDPNFLIVARTDSRTTLGLEEAIRRAISKPLLANMVEGGRTPILPAARLQEIGYAMAIYPAIGFLAAAAALERAYAHLKNAGDSIALGESYGFKRMTELMGFPEVWDFEKKWAVPEKDNAA